MKGEGDESDSDLSRQNFDDMDEWVNLNVNEGQENDQNSYNINYLILIVITTLTLIFRFDIFNFMYQQANWQCANIALILSELIKNIVKAIHTRVNDLKATVPSMKTSVPIHYSEWNTCINYILPQITYLYKVGPWNIIMLMVTYISAATTLTTSNEKLVQEQKFQSYSYEQKRWRNMTRKINEVINYIDKWCTSAIYSNLSNYENPKNEDEYCKKSSLQ